MPKEEELNLAMRNPEIRVIVEAFSQATTQKEWPRQINCGEIQLRGQDSRGQAKVLISAYTQAGLEKYIGTRVSSGADIQSEDAGVQQQAKRHWDDESRAFFRPWNDDDFADDLHTAKDKAGDELLTDAALLERLSISRGEERRSLVCDAETLHFAPEQRQQLLSVLWKYIHDFRDCKDPEELVAVGSAIRKYVAMMDLARVGEVAVLLEAGHRAANSLDLELEVAKMVYRKFEANPPARPDPHPQLAARLWEIAEAYVNPHVILREKHATVASLAIEAVVAMRSEYADRAYQAAIKCPFTWFGEMVSDNLTLLCDRWAPRNQEAAIWCTELVSRISRLQEV